MSGALLKDLSCFCSILSVLKQTKSDPAFKEGQATHKSR